MGLTLWMRLRRSDRGALGIIPTIILLVLGGAAAVVTIAIAKSRETKKPPDVAITTPDVVASRDGQGRPHIQIKWTVAVAPGSAEDFVPESKIACYAYEQSSRARVFIAETSVFVSRSTSRDGSLTITPRLEDSSVQGPVRVRCEVTRGGVGGLRSKEVVVSIPAPGAGPAIDVAAQYAGKYNVVFTRTAGIDLNCEERRNRTWTVRAPGASQVNVEVAGTGTDSIGISSFTSTVSKTGQFSAEMFFNPGDGESRGLLTGIFGMSNGAPVITGNYKADDGHCEYSFIATLSSAGMAGGLTISLEEISGVDGCEPILSTTTLKPGTVLVTVINNTFSFAQVFIYDGEEHLVGHNSQDAPRKGGKASFTSTFVAGRYRVQCDGPGGEDKTVDLIVQ